MGDPPADDLEPLSGNEVSELADLRSEMADTRGKTHAGPWRDQYWHNPGKQARARELIEREGAGSGIATDGSVSTDHGPADADVTVTEADAETALSNLRGMGELGDAWADGLARGGAGSALEAMEEARQWLLADLGAAAGEVMAAFEGLDGNVKVAIYRELGTPYVPRLPPPRGPTSNGSP